MEVGYTKDELKSLGVGPITQRDPAKRAQEFMDSRNMSASSLFSYYKNFIEYFKLMKDVENSNSEILGFPENIISQAPQRLIQLDIVAETVPGNILQ